MRRNRFFLVTGLLGLAACSESLSPTERVAGTYALTTINGQSLPYILVQSGPAFRIEIADGSLMLENNGTFTETLVIRQTDSTAVSTQVSEMRGSWSGLQQLRLVVNGTVVDGTIAGNTITTSDGEFTLVYRRSSDSGRPRP